MFDANLNAVTKPLHAKEDYILAFARHFSTILLMLRGYYVTLLNGKIKWQRKFTDNSKCELSKCTRVSLNDAATSAINTF